MAYYVKFSRDGEYGAGILLANSLVDAVLLAVKHYPLDDAITFQVSELKEQEAELGRSNNDEGE